MLGAVGLVTAYPAVAWGGRSRDMQPLALPRHCVSVEGSISSCPSRPVCGLLWPLGAHQTLL